MTKTPEKNAVEDFNELKAYALGTLALGAAITTFLTQAFHTPLEATLIGATGIGVFFLTIVYLINKSEQRMRQIIHAHEHFAEGRDDEMRADIKILKERALENQRSALRSEMDNEMYRNPSNHDTIIQYAYKYFHELDGDWVQTDKFLTWKAKEEEAGRPVYLPPELWTKIAQKAQQEGLGT